MPSPFPGMDPYLEHPGFFASVHNRLITALCDALQAILPDAYFTDTADRVFIAPRDHRYPDLSVIRSDRLSSGTPTAGAVTATETVVIDTEPTFIEEAPETFVEIFTHVGGEETLVTSIEILSPSNKESGSTSRLSYLAKQRALLYAPVHLVEIDLLRAGAYTSAAPVDDVRRRVPSWAYHVCVHRFDAPGKFHFTPVALESRLPAIAIPLLPGDADVVVDLQPLFDRVYDTGPYRKRNVYGRPVPPPALRPDQSEWVRERLEAAGVS